MEKAIGEQETSEWSRKYVCVGKTLLRDPDGIEMVLGAEQTEFQQV